MKEKWLGLALLSGLVLQGCGAVKPTYFDLQPKEKVAVGSVSVNGYITREGMERLTPGLLQDPVEFYRYTQKAIDSTAMVLLDSLPQYLSDVQIVPISELSANAAYQRASRAVEKSILGIKTSEADGLVYADAIGFVRRDDVQKAEQMMVTLGVDALITFNFDANLEVANLEKEGVGGISASIGPVQWNVIHNNVIVTLYRKGQGRVWYEYFDFVGKENAVAVGFLVGDEHLPRLLASSIQKLPAALADALDKSRNRPVNVAK